MKHFYDVESNANFQGNDSCIKAVDLKQAAVCRGNYTLI